MMDIKDYQMSDEEWSFNDKGDDYVSFYQEHTLENGDPVLDEYKDPLISEVTINETDVRAMAKHFGFKLVKEGE